MATELRFRPIFAGLLAFIVGAAVFIYDSTISLVTYVGHSLFALHWRPDAYTSIDLDRAMFEAKRPPLLEAIRSRWLAFIERGRGHREYFGDHYMPECAV